LSSNYIDHIYQQYLKEPFVIPSETIFIDIRVMMTFCFTPQMTIAGIGGRSALPLFKDILRLSNNMKQAENIRVLSFGDCTIA
jgi:hypothetical protein